MFSHTISKLYHSFNSVGCTVYAQQKRLNPTSYVENTGAPIMVYGLRTFYYCIYSINNIHKHTLTKELSIWCIKISISLVFSSYLLLEVFGNNFEIGNKSIGNKGTISYRIKEQILLVNKRTSTGQEQGNNLFKSKGTNIVQE